MDATEIFRLTKFETVIRFWIGGYFFVIFNFIKCTE